MVLLTTTPEILSAVSLLTSSSSSSTSAIPASESEPSLQDSLPTSLETPISHQTLIALSRALRSSSLQACPRSPSSTTAAAAEAAASQSSIRQSYTLNTLLRNTCPYYPPTSPRQQQQPSAEYLALKARLLREQEQREYDALFLKKNNNTTTTATTTTADNNDEAHDDISPTLILNISLSVLLSALSAFYATRYWNSDGLRVLLSLAAAVVVGVAETVVYAAYLRKVGRARERERKRRESKVVVRGEEIWGGRTQRSWEEGGEEMGKEEQDVARVDVGNEREVEGEVQIWGRGVNGGVRRRIREKWEKEEDRRELET